MEGWELRGMGKASDKMANSLFVMVPLALCTLN